MKVNGAILAGGLAALAWLASACGAATPAPQADKSAEIAARGTLVISIDPGYPPQSELRPDAPRMSDTKCAPTEHTLNQFVGFNVDVGAEIARRLGVEACLLTPPWTQVTGGGWGDRWDLNIGSMTITPSRMEVLYFAQPYYTAPAAFFVHRDNTTFARPADLSGKTIGVCVSCTYEFYLDKSLRLPGQEIAFVVDGPLVVGYQTDNEALQDLALGDGAALDAVLTSVPLGQNMIDAGLPLRQLGGPVFTEFLAVAMDRASARDPAGFVRRITEIVQEMHADGTLVALSRQYYGEDLTTAAGEFDIDALQQFP